MKNNKGISLISLIIYVIVLMILIGIFSNLSRYVNKNISQMTLSEKESEQYLRLVSYISKDTNSNNIVLIKKDTNNNQQYLIIRFASGNVHQYVCLNNNLYFINIEPEGQATKKIQLCKDISGSQIFNLENDKIDIDLTINGKNYKSSFNVDL